MVILQEDAQKRCFEFYWCLPLIFCYREPFLLNTWVDLKMNASIQIVASIGKNWQYLAPHYLNMHIFNNYFAEAYLDP